MKMFGMWHRPFETTLDEVHQTLETLAKMHVTDLFVETFFNGKLIFESSRSLLPKHDFIGHYGRYGTDLLLAFIETGKTYGLKIHAWVENFFVGQYTSISDIPNYETYEPYFLRNRDGSILQKNEINYVFIDPAHPKVQKYIISIYQEIASHEYLGSLHLDYIRYPLSYHQTRGDLIDDNGYTTFAIKQFSRLYNIDGDVLELILNDQNVLSMWKRYKISRIDRMIRKIKILIPEIHISTAVFGNPEHALHLKMQNWKSWIDREWISFIVPMAYYKSQETIFQEITRMRSLMIDVPIYAGLAPSFMGLSIQDELDSIHSALAAGSEGVVLFASQNYLDRHFRGQSDHHEIRLALSKLTINRGV